MEIWKNTIDLFLDGEIWNVIKNYHDYAVSNYGRVKRIIPDKYNRKCKVLKQWKDRKGYLKIELNNKGQFIHRLVLETFNPIENMDKFQVNHINGIKDDNRYPENLEWCTNSENHKHAFKIGLENNKGENHPQSKLTNEIALKIKSISMTNDYKIGNVTQKDIGNKFNLSVYIISKILRGKTWTHVKLDNWIPVKTSSFGKKNGQSKLSNKKIIQIKMLFKLGFKNVEITKIFGVSQSLISAIKNEKIWSHIKV